MKAGTRLALYAAALVALFIGAYAIAGAIVPDNVVKKWARASATHDGGSEAGDGADASAAANQPARGTAVAASGYLLSPVAAPTSVGTSGDLSFQVLDADGRPVTHYTTSHEKDLHLIVVRSDGANFRHVHPTLDQTTGTWSIPWSWSSGGTYRVYTDFEPVAENPRPVTLTRTLDVSGAFEPMTVSLTSESEVDGYQVRAEGDVMAGSTSMVTMTVSREGEAVTTLEPYLGAFGHLVALREGDLAYIHVHPEGDEPKPGATAGPTIGFMVEAPTVGRYRLYLDFQVAGRVHTAEFVVEAHRGPTSASTTPHAETSGH